MNETFRPALPAGGVLVPGARPGDAAANPFADEKKDAPKDE